jgi:hypothetical protein
MRGSIEPRDRLYVGLWMNMKEKGPFKGAFLLAEIMPLAQCSKKSNKISVSLTKQLGQTEPIQHLDINPSYI